MADSHLSSIDSFVSTCPDCKTDRFVIEDYTSGMCVCEKCGLQCGDRMIAEGSEWRTFENDGHNQSSSDPNRVGGPEDHLLGDLGLSTIIGKDSESNLNRYQSRQANSSHDRRLIDSFQRIGRLAGRMSLPQAIVNLACEIFKDVDESKQLKGKKTEAVCVASIFLACRYANVPRSMKEVCALADVSQKDVVAVFQRVQRLKKLFTMIKNNKAPGGANFVIRFCSLLKLPQHIVRAAEHICGRVDALGIADGKRPATIAASAIYLASQLDSGNQRSFGDIAEVAHITVSTIKSAYKKIYNRRARVLPEGYATASSVSNDLFVCYNHFGDYPSQELTSV